MSDEEEYEVETIVSKRTRKGKVGEQCTFVLFYSKIHSTRYYQGGVSGQVEGMGEP